jgi:alpha-L-fucosidase
MLESQILPTPGNAELFRQDRFGLFIHWGLYAMAARHEWIQSMEKIHPDRYRRDYFERFDPDLFDPEAWADAAAYAGMKYLVITTKHHDGFCLWDSQHTDYKATRTPYGKDLIRPMVKAFNDRGLRTGFYYSLLDWHHRDYVVDYHQHPLRDYLPADEKPPSRSMFPSPPDGSKYDGKDINAGRDQSRYAQYMRDQVRELLTEFGDVAALWFDFSFTNTWQKHGDVYPRTDFRFNKGREAWESEKLIAMIRELAPEVMLTDRLDLDQHLSGGDFKTPEQSQPQQWVHVDGKPVTWEACQTFSGSWGYHRDQHDWRTTRQLISTLIDCISKGGNLLLNVGPTGRGEFDPRALNRLRGIGDWMHHHSRSIYGCTQAPDEFVAPEQTMLTYNPEKRRLYVHLLDWPYQLLHLKGKAFADQVEYAQLMHDASEVKQGLNDWHTGQIGAGDEGMVLNLPQKTPTATELPVVELFLKS